MSQRLEFVRFAMSDTANIRSLCRRFTISPRTAYKWIHRYQEGGADALQDCSRRPQHSPRRTSPQIEAAIVRLRETHPAWGARKLRVRLVNEGYAVLPSVSTITAILHRYGLIDLLEAQKHQPCHRFEAAAPNMLWQMDFKATFPLLQGRCHPLTVLDDYSRYALAVDACPDQTYDTVQQQLCAIFRRYGLPQRLLTDNGSPWGSTGYETYSTLGVWLIRLGVSLLHSRIYHPQTVGKDERFHRTLQTEVIASRTFDSLAHCQKSFDRWRIIYNYERPHEALAMAVPASRYHPSPREFPKTLPPIEYSLGDLIRKVDHKGDISFQGKSFRIGKAFYHYPVALRPTLTDGLYNVFFCHQQVAQINLNNDLHTN